MNDRATLTPAARILRTAVQVIVAVAVAIPAAAALLNLGAGATAKITGIAGALVVLVSAAQNALEGRGAVPTVGATPAAGGNVQP